MLWTIDPRTPICLTSRFNSKDGDGTGSTRAHSVGRCIMAEITFIPPGSGGRRDGSEYWRFVSALE